jgi:hypothetical protein
MPSGLRVNWTADASARNSRCRLTEALSRLPKKVPRKPMIIRPTPAASSAIALLSRLRRAWPANIDERIRK